MGYRLGEFECPQCRHVEPAVISAPKDDKPTDYGGIKRARLLLPTSQAGEAAQQASTLATAATHGAGTYLRGGVPPAGLYGYVEPEALKRKPVNEALTAEKHIHYSILVILLLGPSLYYMARVYLVPDFYLNIPKVAYLSGILLTACVPLGLAWLALYSPFHFVKWASIGVCSLSMLVLIASLIIVAGRPGMWQDLAYTSGGLLPTLVLAGVLVLCAWTVWFISLLYRDIQFLESTR